jgi:hypothetical protein
VAHGAFVLVLRGVTTPVSAPPAPTTLAPPACSRPPGAARLVDAGAPLAFSVEAPVAAAPRLLTVVRVGDDAHPALTSAPGTALPVYLDLYALNGTRVGSHALA